MQAVEPDSRKGSGHGILSSLRIERNLRIAKRVGGGLEMSQQAIRKRIFEFDSFVRSAEESDRPVGFSEAWVSVFDVTTHANRLIR